ncbi:hypothetical protein EYE40_07015 [Glaciihabitans arcticus]|uniref:VanZ family protein n=1 Tax=Glaciihabitans arcticus TaxID=2668039 RepID=A0A4V2JEW5_9MICO|nr:hypothetical protein [Glaciihabitans arcticus]TBN57169.1 hypothetical protein EYE40_07015 [Glaciihabitans arcticus]
MLRRHPVLTVVGAVYFGMLCFMALGPRSVGTATFAGGVVLFLPIGPILIGLFGRSRWMSVILLGLLASVWVQLACIVWRSDAQLSLTELASNALGVAAGTALAVAVSSVVSRRERIRHPSFTRLSQTGGSGWTLESPPD